MFIKNFFKFAKYYYSLVGDLFYDNDPGGFRKIRRKDRLLVIIWAYLILVGSIISLFVDTSGFPILQIVAIIASVVMQYFAGFSLIYYFIAYIKFNNKDNSINDRCICDYGITYTCSIGVGEIIKKYFYLRTTDGNIFQVRFHLQAKGERSRKATNFKGKTLKITPNKIYFDGKLIFDGKLLDMADLENFLINESAQPF